MKRKLNLSLLAFLFCLLFSTSGAWGQVISGPLFYFDDNNVTTDLACLRPSANPNPPVDPLKRGVIAEYTGPGSFFGPGTQFRIELSDKDGVFSDETTIQLGETITIQTALGATADIDFPPFDMPINLRGENFKMRIRAIRSGETDFLSQETDPVKIYYFDPNGVSLTGPNVDANKVALCEGESTTLVALPDDFPEYTWSFNGSVIQGETGSTLENITQPGTYRVIFEVGSCNPFYGGLNFRDIEVVDFNQTTVAINEAPTIEFCPSDIKLLTLTNTAIDSGYTYEWFQDGVSVEDSDTSSLLLPQSNFAGIYTVTVTATESCEVTTLPVEVINKGSDITSQPPPQLILLPTQTSLTLTIETNAPAGSTVQWFRSSGPITPVQLVETPGVLSIEVSTEDTYRVEVITNDDCLDTLTAEVEVFIPVGFRVQIASVLDCDADTATLGIEDLFGITGTGLEVPLTTDQYAFFDFEWFKDNVSTGDTGLTIAISDTNDTSIYSLEATLTGGNIAGVRSNEITPGILDDIIQLEATSLFIPSGGTVTLTAPNNSSYTYEWLTMVDGEPQLIDGETNNTLEISEPGQYFVRITSGDCIVDSEVITISPEFGQSEIIPNIITPFTSGNNDTWVLPEIFKETDVEVQIYSATGKMVFQKTGGYNGEWPQDPQLEAQQSIYYYIITKNNSVVRKGSITVMR